MPVGRILRHTSAAGEVSESVYLSDLMVAMQDGEEVDGKGGLEQAWIFRPGTKRVSDKAELTM